jgi:hypothetical protein
VRIPQRSSVLSPKYTDSEEVSTWAEKFQRATDACIFAFVPPGQFSHCLRAPPEAWDKFTERFQAEVETQAMHARNLRKAAQWASWSGGIT